MADPNYSEDISAVGYVELRGPEDALIRIQKMVTEELRMWPIGNHSIALRRNGRKLVLSSPPSVADIEAHLHPNQAGPQPIPIRIHCPECHALHVDEGEWATKPHHTHSCQACGHTWRPAVVHTVGVRFLPGFRNTSE